jgi:hypothetical protein
MNFRGEKRSNDTHASMPDPEPKLARKRGLGPCSHGESQRLDRRLRVEGAKGSPNSERRWRCATPT